MDEVDPFHAPVQGADGMAEVRIDVGHRLLHSRRVGRADRVVVEGSGMIRSLDWRWGFRLGRAR